MGVGTHTHTAYCRQATTQQLLWQNRKIHRTADTRQQPHIFKRITLLSRRCARCGSEKERADCLVSLFTRTSTRITMQDHTLLERDGLVSGLDKTECPPNTEKHRHTTNATTHGNRDRETHRYTTDSKTTYISLYTNTRTRENCRYFTTENRITQSSLCNTQEFGTRGENTKSRPRGL